MGPVVAIETAHAMRAGVMLIIIWLSTFFLASHARKLDAQARASEGHGRSRVLAGPVSRLMRRSGADNHVALCVFPCITLRGADAAHECARASEGRM